MGAKLNGKRRRNHDSEKPVKQSRAIIHEKKVSKRRENSEEEIQNSVQEMRSEPQQEKLLVYGVGRHLADMLVWHPDLKDKIGRVFDKDASKCGQPTPGVGIPIESPEALRNLPIGTKVAIAAILYFEEIRKELLSINPGLICENIDYSYQSLAKVEDKIRLMSTERKAHADKPKQMTDTSANTQQDFENTMHQAGLTAQQRQKMRGKESLARWRQRVLLECTGCRHVFWGVHDVRSEFMRHKLQPMMQPRDIFIENDSSKCGEMVDGLPVCLPDALYEMKEKFIILVLSSNYPEIRKCLMNYGYVENVDFVEACMLLGEDETGIMM